jgi:hypothetical protein
MGLLFIAGLTAIRNSWALVMNVNPPRRRQVKDFWRRQAGTVDLG